MSPARSRTPENAAVRLRPADPVVGYVPFAPCTQSAEAGWLRHHLGLRTQLADHRHRDGRDSPSSYDELVAQVRALLPLRAVVVEGPRGLLAASVLRHLGFGGHVTVLPYVNPRTWSDVLAIRTFSRFAERRDRVWVGSTRSALIFTALGVPTLVGEPYGVDDAVFSPQPESAQDRVRARWDLPDGPLLLYTGRAQPDKDLYAFLRIALRAQLLFPELVIVIATHVVDDDYLQPLREVEHEQHRLHLVTDATAEDLAALYSAATVFLTAALSPYETFGRSAAEALCCGCPVVASRYDGFVDVLAQPGGTLVDPILPDEAAEPPRPDDAGLLRAVYEVLSAPTPVDRFLVASVARERFGRSGSIARLGYLAADDRVVPPPVAPAELDLPTEWSDALQVLARLPADVMLAANWDSDLDRLSACDALFEVTVRRALCAPARSEAVVPCR